MLSARLTKYKKLERFSSSYIVKNNVWSKGLYITLTLRYHKDILVLNYSSHLVKYKCTFTNVAYALAEPKNRL